MEQPMFYQGQRVVAQVTIPPPFKYDTAYPLPIDGKSYYVNDPNAEYREGNQAGYIFVKIQGFNVTQMFWQGLFVPYEADEQLEEQIHESLKGKILN